VAYAQGFHMAKPMNKEAFGRYLDSFADRRMPT
jgi:sensor c-di-GMP phosphodiesterase-like protein